MIAAAIAGLALDRPPLVHRYGLKDFLFCGENDEVLRAHGLDAKSLAREFAQDCKARQEAIGNVEYPRCPARR